MVVVSAVAVGMVVIVGVPMVMMPVMMMVMAVSVGGFAPGVAAQEQRQPEHRDGDARAERDPGVEALRDDVVRGIDGRRPQEIDTPAVGRAGTKSPRSGGCQAFPREPTRYAATTVLPWPGSSACRAPSAAATTRARATTLTVSSRAPMSSVKALPDVTWTLGRGAITGSGEAGECRSSTGVFGAGGATAATAGDGIGRVNLSRAWLT